MKINFNMLGNTWLFRGIEAEDMDAMLGCLSAEFKKFQKGQMIYRAGDTTDLVGIILSGRVHILKEDFWGNRSILSEIGTGDIFGETYAELHSVELEVNVMAVEDSEILFLDVGKIMTTCPSSCEFHSRLIGNLLAVTAQKNLMLTRKMEYMAQRTIREKLLTYLSAESQRSGLSRFEIPFNRQQLADYLSVDRSAMSRELCKLRDEGVLEFNKNCFELFSDY